MNSSDFCPDFVAKGWFNDGQVNSRKISSWIDQIWWFWELISRAHGDGGGRTYRGEGEMARGWGAATREG